ncbi:MULTISPECIES: hypothetical protein [unclassified Arcicella]|uniref:hypothetical protein n=1 Tax=unclassified Arcicella TaxID=2644986 RepID=UPI00285A7AEA|nr:MULTISPECIES: hypothetical protein [unclassified Arcicella]MDR6564262.1 hypothetical protein [Arcicella sp. BE51]MDR6811491.1 hypothetical protein [Arcicella sp. BE140]MDR6826031.1 hypothetical protein [Arcicella sp. BE139]
MKNIKYILLFIACLSFFKVSKSYVKTDSVVSVHLNEHHKGSKCISEKVSNQVLEIDTDKEVDDESQEDESTKEIEQLYIVDGFSLHKITNTPISNLSHYSTIQFRNTVSLFILLLQILI